eukprot:gene25015-33521_t
MRTIRKAVLKDVDLKWTDKMLPHFEHQWSNRGEQEALTEWVEFETSFRQISESAIAKKACEILKVVEDKKSSDYSPVRNYINRERSEHGRVLQAAKERFFQTNRTSNRTHWSKFGDLRHPSDSASHWEEGWDRAIDATMREILAIQREVLPSDTTKYFHGLKNLCLDFNVMLLHSVDRIATHQFCGLVEVEMNMACLEVGERIIQDACNRSMDTAPGDRSLLLLVNPSSRGKYYTFGIGSAGHHNGFQSIGSLPEDIKYLRTSEDLQEMLEYAQKYNNQMLGCVDSRGLAGSKSTIVQQLQNAFNYVRLYRGVLVLYYSGHGDINGDWCNNANSHKHNLEILENQWCQRANQNPSFEAALDTLRTRAVPPIAIISDCCYSGQWVQKAIDYRLNEDFTVVSACGRDKKARDRVFSQAFWKGREVAKAIEYQPMVSHPTPDSPRGFAKFEDGNRCWFINPDRFDVDWKTIPHNWRPPSNSGP